MKRATAAMTAAVSALMVLGALALFAGNAHSDSAARAKGLVVLKPLTIRVSERRLLGDSLALRYELAIPTLEEATFRYWVEHYKAGKLVGRVAEGMSGQIVHPNHTYTTMVTLDLLPPRAQWDVTCARSARPDARELCLLKLFDTSVVVPVPSAREAGGSGWRGAGAQRVHVGDPVLLLVGVFDSKFPAVSASFASKPAELHRLMAGRDCYMVKAMAIRAD